MAKMYETGSGVSFLGIKIPAAVERRIENIVRLSNKRSLLSAAGDYYGLLELAQEYADLGMTRTSNDIIAETKAHQT